MADHRPLKPTEIAELERQGCRAADWAAVAVAEPFDPGRVRDARFSGRVRLGRLSGSVKSGPAEEPCGVYAAALHNVTVGDGCLIRNVGSHLANYQVGDGAVIVDVGLVEAEPGAACGCGAAVEALNEGGGRGVPLYPELSAQVAHLLALQRWRSRERSQP